MGGQSLLVIRRCLSRHRYFYCADVGRPAALFTFSSWHLLCADVHSLDFHVWQESASDDFAHVNRSADGPSSCFYAYFICSAVEEGYASQHIVHCRLLPNQYSVAHSLRHFRCFRSLLVYILRRFFLWSFAPINNLWFLITVAPEVLIFGEKLYI